MIVWQNFIIAWQNFIIVWQNFIFADFSNCLAKWYRSSRGLVSWKANPFLSHTFFEAGIKLFSLPMVLLTSLFSVVVGFVGFSTSTLFLFEQNEKTFLNNFFILPEYCETVFGFYWT